ncbi:hypothetical protein E8D34_09070 [Nocardioides sp. GY 10113]|uniref:hypothetical protein n=1 Tax=Nocardioides sp. GY 10113 TaxID=2569761 RepID=UPI0010A7D1C4|nr:hypothetical protein [Nocardioides sp. GY 10113]TIC87804.1 hypothetical protein E8D34_09070 [Nocardioides sp. GY 10113]
MTGEADPGDGGHEDLLRFWTVARERAKVATLPGYFAPSPLAAVPPPTWSFGEDPAEADRLLEVLLSGERHSIAVLASELAAGEEAPTVGTLGIVVDGSGRPRALVTARAVTVLPAGEVDATVLIEPAPAAEPGAPVLIERLQVLYEE